MGGGPGEVSPLHYQPTLLTGVTPDMEIFQEEVFGPVVTVATFQTEEEALEIANNCRTGLASYFYSQDVSQCWRVGQYRASRVVATFTGPRFITIQLQTHCVFMA